MAGRRQSGSIPELCRAPLHRRRCSPLAHQRVARVSDRAGGERGVVLVWMALTLVIMLMFAAFMVDLGAWYQ